MQMYHACVKGEVENVRQLLEGQPYLLQQDLQIQLGTKEDGTPSFVYWTALTAASSCGQTQVVEVLLGAGAKVNQVDRVYFFLLIEFQRWKNLSSPFFFFFFFRQG